MVIVKYLTQNAAHWLLVKMWTRKNRFIETIRSNEPILSNELDYPTVLQAMRSGKHPQVRGGE